MSLTRKDFIELATLQSQLLNDEIIGCTHDPDVRGLEMWLSTVQHLLVFCAGQNSNFNRQRFVEFIVNYRDHSPSGGVINELKDTLLIFNTQNQLALNLPAFKIACYEFNKATKEMQTS